MTRERDAFSDEFLANAAAIFAEMARLVPGLVLDNAGFSFRIAPQHALAALRALPDGAGEDAVLRALGHDPDDLRRRRQP